MGKRWRKGRVLEATSTSVSSYKTSPRTPALPPEHNLCLLEEQDLHLTAYRAGTDLPRRKAQGHRLTPPACRYASACGLVLPAGAQSLFFNIFLCSILYPVPSSILPLHHPIQLQKLPRGFGLKTWVCVSPSRLSVNVVSAQL